VKYIVTHIVRKFGSLGIYSEGMRTIEAPDPRRARDIAFDEWHAEGFETSGFSVHEEATSALVLGGETSVCGRFYIEHDRYRAGLRVVR